MAVHGSQPPVDEEGRIEMPVEVKGLIEKYGEAVVTLSHARTLVRRENQLVVFLHTGTGSWTFARLLGELTREEAQRAMGDARRYVYRETCGWDCYRTSNIILSLSMSLLHLACRFRT